MSDTMFERYSPVVLHYEPVIEEELLICRETATIESEAKILLEAIQNRDLKSLSALSIDRADKRVNVRLNQYDTTHSSIMLASYYGFTEGVWSLINMGIDLYQLNIIYKRSLLFAAWRAHELCIRLLARYALFKSDIGDDIVSKIVLAISSQEFDHVQELLQVHDNSKWIGRIAGSNVMNLLVFYGSSLDCLRSMIDNGGNINQLDRHGIPPLGTAVIAGNIEFVTFFLSRGADVDLCDNQKRSQKIGIYSPCECRYNNEKGDMIYGGFGKTALMFAALLGRAECLKILLKHGANVNAADESGLTALMHASYHKNYECVKLILTCGKNVQINKVDGRMQSALLHSAYAGDKLSSQLLVKAHAKRYILDIDGRNIFMAALISKEWECALALLKFPQQILMKDKRGKTSLSYVAAHGNSEILKFLLDKVKTLIHLKKEDVKIFLEDPLFCAIRQGAIDCVKVLMENGVNINCRNSYDKTPLMQACESKCTEIFFLLVKNGAKIKVIDKKASKRNILMWAIDCDMACLEYLLQKGANINYLDPYENTMLIMACLKGNVALVKFLVENGADVNHFGICFGKTPLICAVNEGHFECFVLLLNAGANVDHVYNGYTVLHHILRLDRFEFLEILIKQGKLFKDSQLKKVHANSIDVTMMFLYKLRLLIAMMRYGIFSWSWYPRVMKNYRIPFSCVVSGISPAVVLEHKPKNPSFGLNDVRSEDNTYTRKSKVSPLLTAMLKNQPHIVCYLLSNFYFTLEDYRIIICNRDFQNQVRQNVKDETVEHSVYYHETSGYSSGRCGNILAMLDYITTHPLSLQALSFLTASTSISFNGLGSIARAEQVDSLPIPESFKRLLKFQGPLAKLCPRYWHCIIRGPPDCDNYYYYQNLLSLFKPFFPYLKHLVPCGDSQCGSCDGLGLAFV